jgi:archaellum component FlaC
VNVPRNREVNNVKTTVLATAVAAVLMLAGQKAGAQSRSEFEAMQTQLQALAERLNRLEATNTQLQAENAELKTQVERREAETEYLKSQTKELREEAAVASNEINKVKGTDWATKVKARGDLRYRHEEIHRERTTSDGGIEDAKDRYRHRIRARFGVDAQVSDNVKTTLQLATGELSDPRSSNQSLDDVATKKTIGVDLAYADWTFAQGADLIFGKQAYPYYRPGQSLFYDNDFNPEGIAVKFERGILFGDAYGWWLNEKHNDDPASDSTDTFVVGAQLGLKIPMFAASNLVAFGHYYNCSGCQGQSPIFNNSANGNTTVLGSDGLTNLLVFDYEIGELGAEFNSQIGNLPLTLFANYAQNMADGVEEDTAYNAGFRLGRASNPKTWEVAAMYQSVDKDALFGQFLDSDFGNGVTDTEGWALRGAYAPVRNIAVNLTYFINTLNKDVGTELDYDRLQLDLNWRY